MSSQNAKGAVPATVSTFRQSRGQQQQQQQQQQKSPLSEKDALKVSKVDNDNTDESGAGTDAIIEELKALAKSMLDATNAARRRAHTLESRRSYEALMNAIEGRGASGGAVEDAAPSTSTDLPSLPAGAATLPAPPAATHVDPTVGAGVATARPTAAAMGCDSPSAEDDLAQVPASLGPHSARTGERGAVVNPATRARAAGARDEDTKDAHPDEADAIGTHQPASPFSPPSSKQQTQHSSRGAASAATAADDDENIFDGVRSQIFFKTTDTAAYRDVAASAWKPEPLVRRTDGTTVPDELGDDDDEDDEQFGGPHSSSSSSGSGGGGGNAATDEEDGEGADRSPAGRHGSKGDRATPPKPTRVFRVPLFPYGGGVTESEAKELSRRFQQCIRNTSRGAGSSAAASIVPALVTKKDFDRFHFDEVAVTDKARLNAFKPQSPYEFVVEVERPVLFDAVSAREQRRRHFRQLVKKGQAPVTMGTFNLRVIMDPIKTGFEDEKHFPIVRGNIVADRYQIVQLLGKATFSRAVRCYDLHQPLYDDEDEEGETTEAKDDAEEQEDSPKSRKPSGYVEVCLKIINNTKDFFDQSLDEIRLLTLINAHKDPDDAHVIRLIDAFYYKEHTMLVTELLSDNLYEYSKYNREEEDEFYFTLPRLRRIARQITEALAYVHSLHLIHADLKPENVLFVSHRRCSVKVIDFGSSCFLSDHLSSYIQSRSYRAPEVVLGCDYDGRIDVWSLGAILAELVTGDVLFTSETVPEMLARMVYVCGQPFPRRMLWEGRHTSSFINKFGLIYEVSSSKDGAEAKSPAGEETGSEDPYYVYTPVPSYPPTAAASPSRAGSKAADKTSARSSSATEKDKGAAEANGKPSEPYSVLREKLAAAGLADEQFFAFVKDCLTLDHKKRPTSEELLSHPFIVNEKL